MTGEKVRVFLRVRPNTAETAEHSILEIDGDRVTVNSIPETGTAAVTETIQCPTPSSGHHTPRKQINFGNSTPRSQRAQTPSRNGKTPRASWKTPGRIRKAFTFEKIFHSNKNADDAQYSLDNEQQQVFETTTKPLVDQVVMGQSATCLAYGSTGSGKSLTVLGEQNARGIAFRAIKYLFERIQNLGDEVSVNMSFVELYKDRFIDLLSKNGAKQADTAKIEIRQDKFGMFLTGSETLRTKVESAEEAISLVEQGESRRTVSNTAYNGKSSRSHCILTIQVGAARSSHSSRVVYSKLRIVDLAGSERQGLYENENGYRESSDSATLAEAQAINMSLSTLAAVLMSLSKNNEGWLAPYRDSKLTWLLRDSLGGNARTVMITHARQEAIFVQQTLQTLAYASRAKQISNIVMNDTALAITSHDAELRAAYEKITTLESKCSELSDQVQTHSQMQRVREEEFVKTLHDLQQECDKHTSEKLTLEEQLKEVRLKLAKATVLADPAVYSQYQELQASFLIHRRHATEIEERLVRAINEGVGLQSNVQTLKALLKTEQLSNKTHLSRIVELENEVLQQKAKTIEAKRECVYFQDELRLAQIDQSTTDQLLSELTTAMNSAGDNYEASLNECTVLREVVAFLRSRLKLVASMAQESQRANELKLETVCTQRDQLQVELEETRQQLQAEQESKQTLGAEVENLQVMVESLRERDTSQQERITQLVQELEEVRKQSTAKRDSKRKSASSEEFTSPKRSRKSSNEETFKVVKEKCETGRTEEEQSTVDMQTMEVEENKMDIHGVTIADEVTHEEGVMDTKQERDPALLGYSSVQHQGAAGIIDHAKSPQTTEAKAGALESVHEVSNSSEQEMALATDVGNLEVETADVVQEIPDSISDTDITQEGLVSHDSVSSTDKDLGSSENTMKLQETTDSHAETALSPKHVTDFDDNKVKNSESEPTHISSIDEAELQDVVPNEILGAEHLSTGMNTIDEIDGHDGYGDTTDPHVQVGVPLGICELGEQHDDKDTTDPHLQVNGAPLEIGESGLQAQSLNDEAIFESTTKKPLAVLDANKLPKPKKQGTVPKKKAKQNRRPRQRGKGTKAGRSTLFAAFVDTNAFTIPKLKKGK